MYNNIAPFDNNSYFKDFLFHKKYPFYRLLPKILAENYGFYKTFSHTYFPITIE